MTGDNGATLGLLDHLPILQTIIPLLAAPFCLLVANGIWAWRIAAVAMSLSLVVAITLLFTTLDGTVISYALGGWPPPWGIEYRIDAANTFVLFTVASVGTLTLPYAYTSVKREIQEDRQRYFYCALLLCFAGLLGITATGDAFNVFVFLEISSLASYTLIALGSDRRALVAAFQYLMMGTIGATFILIGIGFLYAVTGTLNMMDLHDRIQEIGGDNRTVRVAMAFLTVGISLKLALFPLHLWLPNAYAYAPSAVTVFLAATSTKVAVYLLLRFFFTVYGASLSTEVLQLGSVLMPLALLGIFATSITAIFRSNVKRMLAYSSVAQIGYMILGISLATQGGLTAGVLHLFNHALMKAALFMALGCVAYRLGSVSLEQMAGLSRHMPWTAAAFVVGGLSLVGVPLTVGFISKWYLVLAALEVNLWPVAALILMSSLLALVYIWRVVEVMYFRPPPDNGPAATEAPWGLLIPTWLMVLANIYFGIDATLTVGAARAAADQLLGAAP